MLKSGGQSDTVTLTFPGGPNSREGQLKFTSEDDGFSAQHNVFLADLPGVVETHKTLNNKSFYKSGDIGQIILVQPNNGSPWQVDSDNIVCDGLTPGATNLRKRKFRKRPAIPKETILEAQKEIITLQKGGRSRDFEIEEIPVADVDEIYLTPAGNTIVTLKNGKPPVRAGNPNNFSDAELELLPQQHKEAALKEEAEKEAEFAKNLDAELDREEDDTEDDDGPANKRRKVEKEEVPPENPSLASSSETELPPETEQEIRGWRIATEYSERYC